MAVLKRVLSYEVCLWNIEGNALRGIPILVLRKNGFTEIISFENDIVIHEMGDQIKKDSVKNDVFKWIIENKHRLLHEYNKAASYTEEYLPGFL